MTDYTIAEFRKDFDATPGDRLAHAALHRKYFGQFVTPAVMNTVVQFIGADVIMNSTNKDDSFNDIPLPKWDRLAPIVNRMCAAHMARCDGLGGGRYWTSNGVCVAKEAALQWRERELAKRAGG